jgi:large subunit ribosomal protein L21
MPTIKEIKAKNTGPQAVIKTGGKQYRVQVGDTVKIEKLLKPAGEEFKVGDAVSFDMVLLKDDGTTLVLGAPTIKGSTVTATITDIAREQKVIVGKFKQKSKYFVKNGHRQPFFAVKIEGIN